jgi:hypothetical protein
MEQKQKLTHRERDFREFDALVHERRSMYKVAKWGTAAVAAHTVVSALHGVSHVQVGIEPFPSLFHLVFILGVITLAPVVSLFLLWMLFRRAGAWLLLLSMAGSLIFGVYYHYLAPGPDHFSEVPAGVWGILFHGTAVLLVVTELWGGGVAVWALTRAARV